MHTENFPRPSQAARAPFILLLSLINTVLLSASVLAQHSEQEHPHPGPEEGLGRAHMETSCSPAVAPEFDRALALLHNFWYLRALERFNEVATHDPECAMAYWGAAMTYNHPFWDPPSAADEAVARLLVQKGMSAKKASPRERLYLAALAALYKEGGSRLNRSGDYRDAMAATKSKRFRSSYRRGISQRVKLQWESKAAAVRKDPIAAKTAAARLVSLSEEPGQHPFAKQIITLQAREAEAFAAHAEGASEAAVAKLEAAVEIEDSIDDLSQPPYPVIPAAELCGNLLLELNRPAEAVPYFQKVLRRTPNRPKAIFGLARAAEALGDKSSARSRYQESLGIWKTADPDLPELVRAKAFLDARQ
jgi:tetratricopeptide (TPR) repeat protein